MSDSDMFVPDKARLSKKVHINIPPSRTANKSIINTDVRSQTHKRALDAYEERQEALRMSKDTEDWWD
jgi:hypothetical protein